jgi:hypothetical protein
MINIGLDPGVNTGVAVYDSHHKAFILIKTLSFWEAISLLMQYKDEHPDLHVVLEDPSANKPVFRKKFATQTNNDRMMDKISQNIGSNKRDAQLLSEFLINAEIPFTLVTPTKGKYNKETFEKLTRYNKITSQHGRDAAMLVWGR